MTRRLRLGSAALVFAVSLGLYAATLAPTVTLVDSGELIVAAHTLGVAHPPGFPLYTLLAHLASVVPIGNVAVRVNFASAFFAACAVAVLSLLAAEALPSAGHHPAASQRSAVPGSPPSRRRLRKRRLLPTNMRSVRRPGRCPGLMACRPFRAETEEFQPADSSSPHGAAIREAGAAPRAVSGDPRVHRALQTLLKETTTSRRHETTLRASLHNCNP